MLSPDNQAEERRRRRTTRSWTWTMDIEVKETVKASEGGQVGGGEGCPGDDQMLRCIGPNNQRETIFGQNGGTGYR